MPVTKLLKSFLDDRHGVIAMTVGLSMTVVFSVAAISVDGGPGGGPVQRRQQLDCERLPGRLIDAFLVRRIYLVGAAQPDLARAKFEPSLPLPRPNHPLMVPCG